jgi:hypothetical protein
MAKIKPKPKVVNRTADLFSINSAADILSRTRRTVTRALRGIPAADTNAAGMKRWRLKTIVTALNDHSGAPVLDSRTNGVTSHLAIEAEEAMQNFDSALDELLAMKTIATRRAVARRMPTLLNTVLASMRARDVADGMDDQFAGLRADNVRRLSFQLIKNRCGWTGDEVREIFDGEADDDDDGDDEAAA